MKNVHYLIFTSFKLIFVIVILYLDNFSSQSSSRYKVIHIKNQENTNSTHWEESKQEIGITYHSTFILIWFMAFHFETFELGIDIMRDKDQCHLTVYIVYHIIIFTPSPSLSHFSISHSHLHNEHTPMIIMMIIRIKRYC